MVVPYCDTGRVVLLDGSAGLCIKGRLRGCEMTSQCPESGVHDRNDGVKHLVVRQGLQRGKQLLFLRLSQAQRVFHLIVLHCGTWR